MRSAITPSRNLLSLGLVIALAALGSATAQTYGTEADDTWLERVATAYQTPQSYFDGERFQPVFTYATAYPPIRLDRRIEGDDVTFIPAEGETADCVLGGTPYIVERMLREHVLGLRNAAPGNMDGGINSRVNTARREQWVVFEMHLSSAEYPAVAIAEQAGGLRRYAEAVGTSPDLRRTYVYFSLTELQKQRAINDDVITIATGVTPDQMCRFNLNDLP